MLVSAADHDGNLAAYWMAYSHAPGAAAFRLGANAGLVTGMSRNLFNPTLVADGTPTALAELRVRMRAEIARRGVTSLWWLGLRPDAAAAGATLSDMGLEELPPCPAMECALSDFRPAALPPGVTIETARSAEERAAWGDTVCRFYGLGEALAAQMSAAEARIPDSALKGQERFLLRHDGAAVATACVAVTGAVAGLYAIATDDAARGKGFGRAATEHAMARGRVLGAKVAVLQASPMGRPLYERIGFRHAFDYRRFELTP